MVGLNFKDFPNLGNGKTISSESKLKWKRYLHGVKVRHREFHYPQCDNDKICKQCEISPKMKCFNVRWLKLVRLLKLL